MRDYVSARLMIGEGDGAPRRLYTTEGSLFAIVGLDVDPKRADERAVLLRDSFNACHEALAALDGDGIPSSLAAAKDEVYRDAQRAREILRRAVSGAF